VDLRPRTLGEILDDAWRLALADAPPLLLFNALFLVPAFIVALLLLAQPAPSGLAQGVLPAAVAVLLPLTGLASAACQEWFRRRTADEPIVIRDCLTAALRRGLEHATARAVLLGAALPGPLLLMGSFLPDTSPILRFLCFLFGSLLTFLLSLPLWGASASLHVLLNAGASRSGTLLRELRRDVAAAPGKSAALVLSRLPLLILLVIQLHLFAKVILWTADNLGGFDTSLLDVQLALLQNPVYTMSLFLLGWLLLTPFFEAGNFLLHIDIRTRQEGLDLQHRVQRAFAGLARSPGDKINRQDARNAKKEPERREKTENDFSFLCIFLGVLGVLAVHSFPARATEGAQREIVRSVRQEIETIRVEIEKAEPYPGGQRWVGRLRGLPAKLIQASGGDARRYRWFERALADFGDRKKEDALRVLDDLHRRLSLLEDSLTPRRDGTEGKTGRSPEDVKSLLRGSEGRKVDRSRPRQPVEEEPGDGRREEVRPEQPKGDQPHEGGGRGVAVPVSASSGGGLSLLGWLLLAGLALAVTAVGILLYLNSPRSPKPERISGTDTRAPANDARQVLEESPAVLWRQADVLADAERFRDAVRLLYLAVLALLHRRHFIRFEPTRTNGEYVHQVRLSEQAPPELHEPFQRLTNLFETAWYGEHPCAAEDYRACRMLAGAVQHGIGETVA
jgi:hypothetical protein